MSLPFGCLNARRPFLRGAFRLTAVTLASAGTTSYQGRPGFVFHYSVLALLDCQRDHSHVGADLA
jgi:hypothetical protein